MTRLQIRQAAKAIFAMRAHRGQATRAEINKARIEVRKRLNELLWKARLAKLTNDAIAE